MEVTESRSSWKKYLMACRTMPERDRRNANIASWTLALWGVTFIAAVFLLERELIPAGPLVVLAVLVPTVIAIFAVLAYIRFLRQADELHRKIQFEALALGFGAGFVASFGLELLERAGWATAEAGDSFSIMLAFYILGMVLGTRRYA